MKRRVCGDGTRVVATRRVTPEHGRKTRASFAWSFHQASPKHVTIVHVHVKAERVADFITAMRLNHEASIHENGNRRFDVLQAKDDPTRFAEAGRVLGVWDGPEDALALDGLVDLIDGLTVEMELPLLSRYGVTSADVPRIVEGSRGSSMKTNPVVLSDAEIAAIVTERL